MSKPPSLLHPEDRVLSTLEKDGSRRWMYPRLATGRFLSGRRIVAYILIAIFTALPLIPINGKPAVWLDLAHRRFTLFGYTFLPTDTFLLALFLLSVILTIFFVTALFGRVWCGWACPQSVYLEFVYRPIERLFSGRSGVGGKAKDVAGWRTIAMYVVFLAISFYLANTFLAYFVGVEQLSKWVLSSPAKHPVGFTIVLVVTALMMFDFAYFREQTCIVACPYGRFQSALLDRNSLIISYDPIRGEPRGRKVALTVANRTSGAVTPKVGDCIDCSMCVQVCPTGIDIRNGLQLECLGCAQCIDACDAVMDKIGRARGLIRYSSQARIEGAVPHVVRPRIVIYSSIIVLILAVLTAMIVTKSPTDVTLLRAAGSPFSVTSDGKVENRIQLKLTNRTDRAQVLSVSAVNNPRIRVIPSRDQIELPPGAVLTESVRIEADQGSFANGKSEITIRLTADDGRTIDRSFLLLGPSPSTRENQ